MMHRSERGNILFLILIAVVLFAALSYAVTQSGRSSGGVDKEQQFISSARLTEIGSNMQQSVLRMILTQGIPVSSIQLHPPANVWTNCTTGANCLFAPEGGNSVVPVMPQHIEKGSSMNPMQAVYTEIADGTTVSGVGGGLPVLILWVEYINKEACVNLLQGLNLPTPPITGPSTIANGYAPNIPAIGPEPAPEGCFHSPDIYNGTASGYVYYHVLATQ